MKNLEGKVAFITGGASGIGLGIATAFLKAGIKVAIGDIAGERAQKAAGQLKKISDDILALTIDTSSEESVEKAAQKVEAIYGNVHIVCNNAGIGGGRRFLDTPMERWQRVIDVNLWGVLHGINVFLPRLLQHGEGGHIVNTSSFSGIVGHHSQSCYGTSKFAVVGMTEYLRNDLEKENVSASVLCPHVVDTPIYYPDLADADVATIEKFKQEKMPWLKKIGVDAEETGNMVLRGIETDELYIFTDGTDSREMMEGRTRALFEAMDRQFPPR
ncbi:MAG: SDR family NAD(P)-dependent oxidoreductase [Candidatus Azotimanducaceae bacterium]|uniref:SDR family NAD(P)-dependent oxidoreductase n=1 Tax=OM182 bacterium TaxID=2510334 RepID=A0A520S3A4_9GAMM|nr:short-chain dehydrogenase [Gammaproteobacteria bacterium]RZO76934.1 MAG: SDR family NAD(P)-dependent oxidoreductase [OM182 bacterium]